MTTYTREQVAEAIELTEGLNLSESKVVILANALGLTVEDPKPEPGALGWHEETGRPAYVDDRGAWRVIMANGKAVYVDDAHDFPTPARVVPAEPVELTEEQVGEMWDARRIRIVNWSEVNGSKRMDITATVNAARRRV